MRGVGGGYRIKDGVKVAAPAKWRDSSKDMTEVREGASQVPVED